MIEQIYETICETNEKIIIRGAQVESFVFFIKGNDSTTIPLNVTAKNKEDLALQVKAAAIKKGVDGYIIVSTMTSKTIKKGDTKIPEGDCCIRLLYTQKEKVANIVWYKDNIIIDTETIKGRGPLYDIWDAWNYT